MTRIFAAASLAVLLAACNAQSDGPDNDAAATAGTETVCPDAMIVGLDAYTPETLPTTSDFDLWHVENITRDGVKETASGLQYKVIQAGLDNGVAAVPGEEIVAHYHGYFPNGEVFDSSYERGSPLVYASNAFISGWNEALEDMKVCEARTLYVPADLAYGNSGAGGRPTGTLVFNMQLLRVNRVSDAE
jgi:hypothetical protein